MNNALENIELDISVSIILPVYNGESYIEKSINSILEQDYTHYELLVINDGSTDKTASILDKLSNIDKRIIVIHQDNNGLVYSLNKGIMMSKYDYIVRMDADDISLPNRISEQIQFMEENPEVVCAGTAYEIIDENDYAINMLTPPIDNEEIVSYLEKGHSVICHPSAIIRKQTLIQVGQYREEYYPAEDLDLWLRLSEIGMIHNIPKSLLKYRVHGNSICGTSGDRQLDAAKRALEDAGRRRGKSYQFEPDEHFRPDSTSDSIYAHLLKHGWWAYHYKNKRATFHYAYNSIKTKPFEKDGWKLFFCAIFK